MAIDPSFEAGREDKEPIKDPIGVRTALAMTTSCLKNESIQGEH